MTRISNNKLEKLKSNIKSYEKYEIKIFYSSGDFENLDDSNRGLDVTRNTLGNINILINSMGIVQFESFIYTNIEDFIRCLT